MTKRRKRWPNDLDKPIRHLPIEYLTHGGRINEATVDEYNKRALQNIADAKRKERLKKLSLLADHYNVGRQNYKGIAEALASEFIPKFDGNLDRLKQEFGGTSNQSLAILLAAKCVRGFQYEPLIIQPENSVSACDISTRQEFKIVSGAMRGKLADGRPEIWTKDKLLSLLDAVEKIHSKDNNLTDRGTLQILMRRSRSEFASFGLDTLENRLQDAKKLKTQMVQKDKYSIKDLLK